jgi:predicted DNA binding CopG/RHH family protein
MDEKKRKPGRPKTGQPTKDRRVTFRMEETAYARLKEYSSSKGLTVAETINEAIESIYQSKK